MSGLWFEKLYQKLYAGIVVPPLDTCVAIFQLDEGLRKIVKDTSQINHMRMYGPMPKISFVAVFLAHVR